MTKLEGNGQPLQRVGNQLMIIICPKRKSKNKRTTQVTQDEEVSDTDTEQQTSEHETFLFYVSIQGGLPFVVKFLLLHKFFEI